MVLVCWLGLNHDKGFLSALQCFSALDEIVENFKTSASWSIRGIGAEKPVSWNYLQFGEREERVNL